MEARLGLVSSERRVAWLNACAELQRWERTAGEFTETHRLQLERVRAEEARFSQGRVPAFSVLQAGDEAQQFELGARQAETQAHSRAWALLRLAGALKRDWQERLARASGDAPQGV